MPSLIIAPVESMFSTIFWAVPLFIRVEPVTTSGPGVGVMAISAVFSTWEPGLQEMPITWAPCFLA